MVDAVGRGVMVTASGGLIGNIVRALEDDKIEFVISDSVTVKFVKSSLLAFLSITEPK